MTMPCRLMPGLSGAAAVALLAQASCGGDGNDDHPPAASTTAAVCASADCPRPASTTTPPAATSSCSPGWRRCSWQACKPAIGAAPSSFAGTWAASDAGSDSGSCGSLFVDANGAATGGCASSVNGQSFVTWGPVMPGGSTSLAATLGHQRGCRRHLDRDQAPRRGGRRVARPVPAQAHRAAGLRTGLLPIIANTLAPRICSTLAGHLSFLPRLVPGVPVP